MRAINPANRNNVPSIKYTNKGANTKPRKASISLLPTKQMPESMSPSILFIAKTAIVLAAGIAHAAAWKYWELPSIASCPHFNPAAKNHVNVKITHQIEADIRKKYSNINTIVQGAWFVPWFNKWTPLFFDKWHATASSDMLPAINAIDIIK